MKHLRDGVERKWAYASAQRPSRTELNALLGVCDYEDHVCQSRPVLVPKYFSQKTKDAVAKKQTNKKSTEQRKIKEAANNLYFPSREFVPECAVT